MRTDSKYVQARVDEETWRWIRQLSLNCGLTIKSLILEALKQYEKTKQQNKEI